MGSYCGMPLRDEGLAELPHRVDVLLLLLAESRSLLAQRCAHTLVLLFAQRLQSKVL